jgi:adenylate kinase
MSVGKLVPDDITINLVKERLQADDVKDGIILDGFPRTVKQAEELDRMLEEQGKKIDMVINLTTPREEIFERLVNRRVCSNPNCKTIYNIVLNPPKQEGICDKCGSKIIQRDDDKKETLEARLEDYEKTTKPLVDYYEQKGILHTELVSKSINRLGKDVAEEIIKEIKGDE